MTTLWLSSYAANGRLRPHLHQESSFTIVVRGGHQEPVGAFGVKTRSIGPGACYSVRQAKFTPSNSAHFGWTSSSSFIGRAILVSGPMNS
jgi:hypothetical protein